MNVSNEPLNDDSDFEPIRPLAESLHALNQSAALEFASVVDNIVRTRSHDVRHIEQTLDLMLGFCGYELTLKLYKKLCRYYWDIDPSATAFYVNTYREMWDSDEDVDGHESSGDSKPTQ